MSQSLSERKRELDTAVKGWLTVVFRDVDEHGRVRNGLGPADFEKVMQGYACPDCLAEFHHYWPVCPVCGFKRDVGLDIQQAPGYWRQHLEDRETGYRGPVPDPAEIDKHLERVGKNKDVEQIELRKLRKTRKGARRG